MGFSCYTVYALLLSVRYSYKISWTIKGDKTAWTTCVLCFENDLGTSVLQCFAIACASTVDVM